MTANAAYNARFFFFLFCAMCDSFLLPDQEADMDEEGDAERAALWDLGAADAAYKAQVEAALAQQRAVEEEQRMLLEQLEVAYQIPLHCCCSVMSECGHFSVSRCTLTQWQPCVSHVAATCTLVYGSHVSLSARPSF